MSLSPGTQLAIICIVVLLVAAYIFFTYHQFPVGGSGDTEREKIADNLTKMRRLWTESSYLTRMNTVEGITGYLGANATHERILANANQVGRNLGTMYGSTNGDKFANLLRERHGIFHNIMILARQNKDYSGEVAKLKDNTKGIVDFWTSINDSVNPKTLEGLLQTQADHTIKKIAHTSKHETIASMNSFDSCNKTIQELMDYLDDCTWKHLTGSSRY